ncbi:hypothetical protein PG985_014132 [Apiospora marii]|uniref:uncharacterized protein n=1 Tax=Apiospora marii TaxID=335849 RepID=UPI003131B814
MVADSFAFQQLRLDGYWKFVTAGSGLPFHVPCSAAPRNLLHALVTLPGASIPLDYIPSIVTCPGPLILSSPPAVEQDPELAAWLQ